MYGAFAGSDCRRCPSDIDSCLEQNEQELEQSCAHCGGGENVMINRTYHVTDVKKIFDSWASLWL
jgi:hypothetical protein